MKLITEHLDKLEYTTEAKDNGEKDVFIEGIFTFKLNSFQSNFKTRKNKK